VNELLLARNYVLLVHLDKVVRTPSALE
jgi:hypothetical protein